MYLKLDHPATSLDEYLSYMDAAQADELVSLAAEMRGLRMAHLNSTPPAAVWPGAAVHVPLSMPWALKRSELSSSERTRVFPGHPKISHLLQAPRVPCRKELEVYHKNIRQVAKSMRQDSVVRRRLVQHDPQLAALAGLLPRHGQADAKGWFWICHIDLPAPTKMP